MNKKKAVVLLYGGLDSATTLYWAKQKGFKIFCLIFDYGQRHPKEIKKALVLAKKTNSSYKIVKITLPWKGSALLDKKAKLPRNRDFVQMKKEIPSTYVPSRNIIFLSFASSYAEGIGAKDIFIGANALDYSGYPDCRPSFFKAFRQVLQKGTKEGVAGGAVKIHTPLLRKTKSEIIRLGLKLKVPYHLTWSCYQGGRKPCGLCDSCSLRAKGFKESGIKDPVLK